MSNSKIAVPSCRPRPCVQTSPSWPRIGTLAVLWLAWGGGSVQEQTSSARAAERQAIESGVGKPGLDASKVDASKIGFQSGNLQSLVGVQGDVFPLPATGPDVADPIGVLFQWIEKIASLAPQGEDEAAQTAHRRKVVRSIVLAADRALSLNPSDEQAMQCHFLKLQALRELVELDGQVGLIGRGGVGARGVTEKQSAPRAPQANRLLERAIAAARADKRPNVVAVGMKFLLESSFAKWSTLSDGQKTAVIRDVANYIASAKLQSHHLQVLMAVANFLDSMGDNRRATLLLNQVLPHLRSIDNPEMRQQVAILEGLQRRFRLPGNKIKVEGTLVDGKPVNWAAYRGKIVLIDFWATWCGPCRAELPNVLKLYHAYHDKGFDVIGICLDDNQESVKEFIANERIPWVTLFSTKKSQRGWANPLATYYGITGIPRAILVDREGTVVDMNARGEQLAQQLRKRLGEPLAKARFTRDTMVRRVSDHSSRE